MKKQDVIRAWRDGELYASLDAEQKSALPANPADLPQLEDAALRSVTGGCSFGGTWCPTSAICSPCPPGECY
ncbi:MAG: mersacidin/lichenicidin family type 2 lantibiotic [Holophagales bacterium]|nr:mersacidin/lichenicidin family type 2 lantibiotic [Holophagales bacterium]